MNVLSAAIRALRHLHRHVLMEMQKEFVVTPYNGPDYNKHFYREIYQIHLAILDILRLLYQDEKASLPAKVTYTKIFRELDAYLGAYWFHLDDRKIFGNRRHQQHFLSTYQNIEEEEGEAIEDIHHEQKIFARIEQIFVRIDSLLDTLSRRSVESTAEMYQIATDHDKVRIWRKLSDDIRKGLKDEKKLIRSIEASDESAAEDLAKLRREHHFFLEKLRYNHLYEIPDVADLPTKDVVAIVIKHHVYFQTVDILEPTIRMLRKKIKKRWIIDYMLEKEPMYKRFERFYEEERRRLARMKP